MNANQRDGAWNQPDRIPMCVPGNFSRRALLRLSVLAGPGAVA